MVYFNTGLVRNLGHINVFLQLWAQLFQENLGTRRLAIKLEGTQFLRTKPGYKHLAKKFKPAISVYVGFNLQYQYFIKLQKILINEDCETKVIINC